MIYKLNVEVDDNISEILDSASSDSECEIIDEPAALNMDETIRSRLRRRSKLTRPDRLNIGN